MHVNMESFTGGVVKENKAGDFFEIGKCEAKDLFDYQIKTSPAQSYPT